MLAHELASNDDWDKIYQAFHSADAICIIAEQVDEKNTLNLDNMDEVTDVAWQQPVRLRNRIVHGYWSIDLQVLHTTATEQLPGFVADMRNVLSALTSSA